MRSTILISLLVGGILAITIAPPHAQPNIAGLEQVKDNLYVITGGGGNTAAFITSDGVVVVDTKLSDWGQPILDQIQTVTDKPVTMIINTHTHGDHVGSNDEFSSPVEIVAHRNTDANMQRMPIFDGDNARYLPSTTFANQMSLLDGDDQIDLYYFGRGHTDGDAFVVFPALRTVHTGDLFASSSVPIVDRNNGGSVLAYPDTVRDALAGISGVDTVIPGHRTVTDWATFSEFGDFTYELVTAIRKAKLMGRGIDDTVETLELPSLYDDYDRNPRLGSTGRMIGGLTDFVTKAFAELEQ